MSTDDQHPTILAATSELMSAAVRYVDLPLEPGNALNIEPFGALLGRPKPCIDAGSDFYRGSLAISRPVEFRCSHPVELSLAMLARRAGEVRYLERHFAHTQTFIPLGGKPFVVVVAPPSQDDMPELAAARAFRFDGTTGFALHMGTWHEFPFAIVDGTDLVVVMSSQTGYDLATKNPATEEAFGPDLDKKDIARRTGVILRINLDSMPSGT